MIGNRSSLSKRFRFATSVLICVLLAGCSSPEDQERNREKIMLTMAGTSVEHLLDRNPETMLDSMTILTRDEMATPLVDRLQSEKIIPESVLSIRKMIDDAEKRHSSNKVLVESVKPIDDPKKMEVRFQVVGKDVSQLNKQLSGEKPFEYTVTCKLTPQMDGLAKITEFVTPTVTTRTAEAELQPGLKKRRKHR